MMTACRPTLLAALVALASGCAATIHAQPLDALPLAAPRALVPSQRGDARVLVYPFSDERGPEWLVPETADRIPIVSFFYGGHTLAYPEQAGLCHRGRGDGDVRSVGNLGAAMPSLLANAMRRMGYTPWAASVSEAGAAPAAFDYFVTGRLKSTRLTNRDSTFAALLVGVLGVPYESTSYDLEFEVTLYHASDGAELLRKTYRSVDRRVSGLYYNKSPATDLFARALEQTLPSVVEDLAAVTTALERGRRGG